MPQPAPLRPGDPLSLGGYTLSGRLGFGGQGVVYLGHDRAETPVAVKVLHADLAADDHVLAQFLREVSAAKQVARFCTAQILDADVAGDRPYVVSEYVDGPSLATLVTKEGPRTGAALERLAIGMATALTAIHQAGIVHRDFKPGNVLVGPDGPRVIDFGISRALDVSMSLSGGLAVGTPAYMAPEQFRGERIGPPLDVFSFGGTLVYAACGRPPFGSDTLGAVMHRILTLPPDLGGLTGSLGDLAAACLFKDPADRPEAREILLTLLSATAVTRPDPATALARGRTAADTDIPTLARRPPQNAAADPLNLGLAAATGPLANRDTPEDAPDVAASAPMDHDGPTDNTAPKTEPPKPTDRAGRAAANGMAEPLPEGDSATPETEPRDATPSHADVAAVSGVAEPPPANDGAAPETEPGVGGSGDGGATEPGRGGRARRRGRDGVLAGVAAVVVAGVLGTGAMLASGGGHGREPVVGVSSRGMAIPPVLPSVGTSAGSPSPSTSARTSTSSPAVTGHGGPGPTHRRTSHPVTTPPVTPGTLSVEHPGLPMGSDWTSATDQIMALDGPVRWTATAGPHLAVTPQAGRLDSGAQAALVISHTDTTTSGQSTVVVTGERGSVTITVTWGP